MKKVLTLVVALAMAASLLVACGGTDDSTAGGYQDGTYRVEAQDFSNGYKEFMEVTYKDGAVESVDFDAYNQDDPTLLKSTLTIDEYPMYDADGNEFHPAVWYPLLEEAILNAATPEDVEVIAGATRTSGYASTFLEAVQAAALAGDTSVIVVDLTPPVDGTYRAEAQDFSNGYKEFMEVTYKDGKIETVTFNAYNEEDPTLLKSTLTIDEYPMYDADGNEFHPAVWYPLLEEAVLNATTPEDVGVVAGATRSSGYAHIFLEAIQAAAGAGNTETIVVDLNAA